MKNKKDFVPLAALIWLSLIVAILVITTRVAINDADDGSDLPEMTGIESPTVDQLPPVTLDGSHLPDMTGTVSLPVDQLPPLEE